MWNLSEETILGIKKTDYLIMVIILSDKTQILKPPLSKKVLQL